MGLRKCFHTLSVPSLDGSAIKSSRLDRKVTDENAATDSDEEDFTSPLKDLGQYDAVIIITDHSSYDYQSIVDQSQLVIDTRNATKDIRSPKIVRC